MLATKAGVQTRVGRLLTDRDAVLACLAVVTFRVGTRLRQTQNWFCDFGRLGSNLRNSCRAQAAQRRETHSPPTSIRVNAMNQSLRYSGREVSKG